MPVNLRSALGHPRHLIPLKPLSLSLCAALISFSAVSPQAASLSPPNAGFEAWDGNGRMQSWSSPQTFDGARDCETRHGGNCSLHLSKELLGEHAYFQASQTRYFKLPAGSRIRISGWIKVSKHTQGLASLWIKGQTLDRQDLRFDNMADSAPRGSEDWRRFQASIPVTDRTHAVSFGVLFSGDGDAWFDDLRLDAEPPGPPREPPDDTDYTDDSGAAHEAAVEAHRIQSLTSARFDDLAFLRQTLSGKNMIALGESSHGVAEFTAVKVRLIKFLHEALGFNLIAFEAPSSACASADRKIGVEAPENVVKECLFGIWQTKEMLELFRYIASTRAAGGDLHIAGFDIQDMSLADGTLDTLAETLDKRDATAVSRLKDAEARLKKLRAGQLPKEQGADLGQTYDALAREAGAYAAAADDRDIPDRLARFAREMSARAALANMLASAPEERQRLEIRDQAMAANVAQLAAADRTKKIVLWAHNAHIERHAAGADAPRMMGDRLHDRFADRLYTVGLFMGEGSATFNNRKRYDIAAPDAGTLEGILRRQAMPMGFFDLSRARRTPATRWMFNSILTRDWGTTLMPITPSIAFDGMLYIDTVNAPEYLP